MLKRLTMALLCSLFLLSMSACTTTRQVIVVDQQRALAADAVATPTELTWWRFALKIQWQQQETPAWHMDLLLADQIVAPVLSEYAGSLRLCDFIVARAGIRRGIGLVSFFMQIQNWPSGSINPCIIE